MARLSVNMSAAVYADANTCTPETSLLSDALAPLGLTASGISNTQTTTLTVLVSDSAITLTKPPGDLMAFVLLANTPIEFRAAAGEEPLDTKAVLLFGTDTKPVVASADFDFRIAPIAGSSTATVTLLFVTKVP